MSGATVHVMCLILNYHLHSTITQFCRNITYSVYSDQSIWKQKENLIIKTEEERNNEQWNSSYHHRQICETALETVETEPHVSGRCVVLECACGMPECVLRTGWLWRHPGGVTVQVAGTGLTMCLWVPMVGAAVGVSWPLCSHQPTHNRSHLMISIHI